MLSGVKGQDDSRDSLYLSPLQTALDPADGVVNLVMCHHPPDWFIDHDDVEDAVCGRAEIHLFGHKHRQRLSQDAQYIRLSAGAVNPDRKELGWEPGYNLFSLSVNEVDGKYHLNIEVHLLVWQTSPDMFRPKMTSNSQDIFRHRLPIRGLLAQAHNSNELESLDTTEGAPTDLGATAASDLEATMSDELTRNLVLRFWSLASSQRREIALQLGLIDQDDLSLPEPERYGRALLRAGELRLLERLAEEVARMERS